MARLGLISDTHNVLDPRVAVAFADVDRILHAGDICSANVLWEIESLGKPVDAVRGNCDTWEAPGVKLPDVARLTVDGVRLILVHDRWFLSAVDEADVVIFGHTHTPTVTEIDGKLWVNPGSASQPRRSSGRSVALLEIAGDGSFSARAVLLDDLGPAESSS